jgi:hypothetical protein
MYFGYKDPVIYGSVAFKSRQYYEWFRKLVICIPVLAYEYAFEILCRFGKWGVLKN